MFFRARSLAAFLTISLVVNATPVPLGHTTPKYASSRIIYRETPTSQQTSPKLIPRFKEPKLPYHSNLNFGDHDEDGPEPLPVLRREPSSVMAKKFIRGLNCDGTPEPGREDDSHEAGSETAANFTLLSASNHNKLTSETWDREQNEKLRITEDLVVVNMRLEAGATREVHSHVADKWAYVLRGSLRVNRLSQDGKDGGPDSAADVNPGDLWYFPAGNRYSVQAKDTLTQGTEILLLLDSARFDENDVLLPDIWSVHPPFEEVKARTRFGSESINSFLKGQQGVVQEE